MILHLRENDIQRQIISYLKLYPKAVPYFWRQNTGATKITGKHRERFIRFGQPGISDILGILCDGRFLAIEVKTPKRRKYVSKPQKQFLDTINGAGGVGFVACSIEDVEKNLQGYL